MRAKIPAAALRPTPPASATKTCKDTERERMRKSMVNERRRGRADGRMAEHHPEGDLRYRPGSGHLRSKHPYAWAIPAKTGFAKLRFRSRHTGHRFHTPFNSLAGIGRMYFVSSRQSKRRIHSKKISVALLRVQRVGNFSCSDQYIEMTWQTFQEYVMAVANGAHVYEERFNSVCKRIKQRDELRPG